MIAKAQVRVQIEREPERERERERLGVFVNRTWQKLSFFASLYFVQGAAFAYAVNFQKPYLTGRGLDMGTVGFLTSVLLLPFILKIFLGMLSDRVPLGRVIGSARLRTAGSRLRRAENRRVLRPPADGRGR